MITITIEIPEQIGRELENVWGEVNLSRGALEALACEAYRQDILTRDQVGELLGFDTWQTEEFLKARKVYLHYAMEDLCKDIETSRRLLSK
jgi:predicted HTH domain antitoxin